MCGKAKKSKCLMEIGRAHCLPLITPLCIPSAFPTSSPPPQAPRWQGGAEGGGGGSPGSPGTDTLCDLRQSALSGLPLKMGDPFV